MVSTQYMIYEDYKKSALKHLKTCEYMIENLNKITENDVLDNLTKEERKNHILREIYYLLGYVLEGTINYCIYQKLNFPPNDDIKNLDASLGYRRKNRGRYIDIGACFRFPGTNTLNLWYDYFIGSHDYAKNIEILERLSNNINTFISNLRNPNINSDNYKNYQLFVSWKVEQRYQTDNTNFNPNSNLTYNEQEINNFFLFVYDIYTRFPTL